MHKSVSFLLLGTLGLSILCSIFCFHSGHLGQNGHHVVCPVSSFSCVYIGTGLLSLFWLSFVGIFPPKSSTFIPEEVVSSLFKPPQLHF